MKPDILATPLLSVQSLPVKRVTASEIASQVPMTEYQRLLQLPRNHELQGEILERAEVARVWYRENGNPFFSAVRVELQEVEGASVYLTGGTRLRSSLLADRLRAGSAFALVILAASAGREVADKVCALWKEGRPDEAFFLDRFAVAVTEWLVFRASTMFCRESSSRNETLLPHLSPGCGGWDLKDQQKLMSLLIAGAEKLTRPSRSKVEGMLHLGPVRLHSSGALDPQHSVLAALGVTGMTYAASTRDLCRSCDLHPCSFRRAPYRDSGLHAVEAK